MRARVPGGLALAAVPLVAAGAGALTVAPTTTVPARSTAGAVAAVPSPRAPDPATVGAPPASSGAVPSPSGIGAPPLSVLPGAGPPGQRGSPGTGSSSPLSAGRSRSGLDRLVPVGAMPVAVALPSVGVRAPLVPLGLEADRRMEVPEDFEVAGWYVHGPRPGEPGAAVIVGHVDSTTGPAVFHRLSALRAGDRLHVDYDDGRRVRFEVTGSRSHPKEAFPTGEVFGAAGRRLRLITCTGRFDAADGHYEENLVVSARLTGSG